MSTFSLAFLFVSQAHAGGCPADSEVYAFGGLKGSSSEIYLGDLQIVVDAGGVAVSGLDSGDDRVLELYDGQASLWSASGQTPTGGESLNILDRGEAGDNIFDARPGKGFSSDDTVLELNTRGSELSVFTGSEGLVIQAACDDGSTLGVLLDAGAGEASVVREQGGAYTELGTVSYLGTGWGFPPTVTSVDSDGSIKTLSVSSVSLESVSMVNDAAGAAGIKVDLQGSKVQSLQVQNAARVDVDAQSSTATLKLDGVSSCSVEGSVGKYIGETEKNLSYSFCR